MAGVVCLTALFVAAFFCLPCATLLSCPPPVECGARDPHSAAPRGTAGALAPSVCGAVTFPLA
ncbi:hypothetical protein PF004_g32607 [Phytophthora fragariae]|uniref:Uncharacterized protein n=1 Tax=Phytophthora fragariae TaxID=53985 RepID=A0A6G0M6W0_9STRA|nr:hypothetical protein PF004_g32607 [Phytophthora fragariae]